MLENKYEKQYWENDLYVMGIDEAGRGPLAGPLVVACCVFPLNYQNDEINDSKKLTEKQREKLFKQIIKDAHYFSFKIVSPKEIDELNIYAATKKAMNELSLSTNIHEVTLTDAMPIDRYNVIDMVKGDAKSISIAGASILAKVVRDHIMMGYDILYPEYEFKNHKGYPTKRHIELLEKYGLLKIHRLSYKPCKDLLQTKLF